MENYLPTLMYIISGIMLGYTALSIYTISQHIKNQARDIENRYQNKIQSKIEKGEMKWLETNTTLLNWWTFFVGTGILLDLWCFWNFLVVGGKESIMKSNILLIAILLGLLVGTPLLTIASLNTLFATNISYGVSQWFAIVWLQILLLAPLTRSKNWVN